MRDPFACGIAIKSSPMPPMPASSAVLVLLGELVAEVRGLREDLAARAPPPASNNEAVAELLRQIREYCADSAFSTSALTAHAEGVPALSVAIIGAAGILNARAVGKVLKKWEGVDVGGLQVKRRGVDAAGVVWQVVEVLK
jgi:hypothetical protein